MELKMKETEQNDFEEGEAYANALYYFYSALEVLSEDAEKQCEIMGNFNVAWELRDDATRDASAVLNLAGEQLSDEQRAGIQRLLADVAAVPDSVVNVPNVKEEHLRAMNNPVWDQVRLDAKELISLLGPELKRVKDVWGWS